MVLVTKASNFYNRIFSVKLTASFNLSVKSVVNSLLSSMLVNDIPGADNSKWLFCLPSLGRKDLKTQSDQTVINSTAESVGQSVW